MSIACSQNTALLREMGGRAKLKRCVYLAFCLKKNTGYLEIKRLFLSALILLCPLTNFVLQLFLYFFTNLLPLLASIGAFFLFSPFL